MEAGENLFVLVGNNQDDAAVLVDDMLHGGWILRSIDGNPEILQRSARMIPQATLPSHNKSAGHMVSH